tara:strand:+ start:474 stop:1691 length:1218 start_codon:yes stop_codon:yes gene_type:complete
MSLLKKKLFLVLVYTLNAQSSYDGQVLFDYFGTEEGEFTSIIQDSTISGIGFSRNIGATPYLIMASIMQQEENKFDVFFSALKDSTTEIQPRVWDIPGDGNPNDPLSLDAGLIFIPGLDSSVVSQLFSVLDTFADTLETEDLNDIFLNIFNNLSSQLYVGLEGSIEILETSELSFAGIFNTVMIKPALYFPPHTIFIENGEFTFNRINIGSPNITVISPNGGEEWEHNSSYPISWQSNWMSGNVKIELYLSDNLEYVVSQNEINDGSFDWAVPHELESETNYKIKISSLDNPNVYDESNEYFSLSYQQLNMLFNANTINKFAIKPAYPNPFNNNTKINILIDRGINVSLDIYDVMGKKIDTIHKGYLKSGLASFEWGNSKISSGIYFIVLQSKNSIRTEKLIMLK